MEIIWELISDFIRPEAVSDMNTIGKRVATHLTIYRDGSISIASLPSEGMVTVQVEKDDSDPYAMLINVDVAIVKEGIRLEPL